MRWTSALATGLDPERMLGEIAGRILERLERDAVDLLFVFASQELEAHAERISAHLHEHLGPSVLLGCTSGGVIGGGHELMGSSALSVLAGSLPGVGFQAFHLEEADLPDDDSPPRAWHEAIGVSPADAPSFVILPDLETFPVGSLLNGLDYAWPGSVTLGGLPGGLQEQTRVALLLGERRFRKGAVGLALMGDVELVPAVAQGCSPLGRTMTVTECNGPLLKALDGRPAYEVLEEAVRAEDPERLQEGRVLLLGVEMDPLQSRGDGPWLARPLYGVDRQTNALVVGEPLRPGRRVRFHVRDADASREDLERTLDAVRTDAGVSPDAALLFSCLGRGESLYGEPDHDSRIFRGHFGDVPLAGFFAGGEIGPVGGRTHVHGFTSAFGLIRPKDGG